MTTLTKIKLQNDEKSCRRNAAKRTTKKKETNGNKKMPRN